MDFQSVYLTYGCLGILSIFSVLESSCINGKLLITREKKKRVVE